MGFQPLAFLLGIVATAACATSTFWNLWAASGPASQEFVDPIWTWRGLWEICMQYTGEQYMCNQEISIFQVPLYLTALRAFMCLAICLSLIATFVTLIGLQCTKILEDHQSRKRKLMLASGVMHLTACVLVLVSVGWYTDVVIKEFFAYENQDNVFRYELGGAVYFGYSSGFISLAASLSCLCMAGPKESSYVSASYRSKTSNFDLKHSRSEYV